MPRTFLASLLFVLAVSHAQAADPQPDYSRGDALLAEYFSQETAKLSRSCLADIKTKEDWLNRRDEYRRQLLEMLGLDPLPERTDLKPEITGSVESDEFRVENIVFQSRPGLYVTANLYLPKKIDGKLPAILYVCGHGGVKKDGVSMGNKTHYQHHGGWFARNGYACLVIDTLQLGEIEGIHHGTYRYGMWWWLNRGYTSAGVEAWNCVRALDYLQSRPEIDGERIGVTGRSGGGAYSWWIAAIDERIRCAVPVAGITDLQNHVVDGCVEGHCDCMYMVNTYRWDYAQVAALIAPRPLLISNTDSDRIFPLDGVVRLFEQVRNVYTLNGAREKVALNITAGGHKDTQELQVHAFRWMNEHLKKDTSLVEKTAIKFFEPEELKVFKTIPSDERNTKIQETFVAAADVPAVPASKADWNRLRGDYQKVLNEKVFRGWPSDVDDLDVKEVLSSTRDGVTFKAFDFTSQGPYRLRLYTLMRDGLQTPDRTLLKVLDEETWPEFLSAVSANFNDELKAEAPAKTNAESYRELKGMLDQKWAVAFVAPRGIGPTAFDASERKQTQNRRRFYLLGQTLDGMQVWDIRRAVQALTSLPAFADKSLTVESHRLMAGNALYAGLYEPEIEHLILNDLPQSHREGPYYLNVQRYLDIPVTVAMVAEQTRVRLNQKDDSPWKWPSEVASSLGWPSDQIEVQANR